MSKLMMELFNDFTKENVEKGFRECNGYLNSRNVHVKRNDAGDIERIDVTFRIQTGKRADLFMDVAFTDDSEELVRVYGKRALTCADAERVAMSFAGVTTLYTHTHDRLQAKL